MASGSLVGLKMVDAISSESTGQPLVGGSGSDILTCREPFLNRSPASLIAGWCLRDQAEREGGQLLEPQSTLFFVLLVLVFGALTWCLAVARHVAFRILAACL